MKFSHLLICVLAVNGGVDAARLRGRQLKDSSASTGPAPRPDVDPGVDPMDATSTKAIDLAKAANGNDSGASPAADPAPTPDAMDAVDVVFVKIDQASPDIIKTVLDTNVQAPDSGKIKDLVVSIPDPASVVDPNPVSGADPASVVSDPADVSAAAMLLLTPAADATGSNDVAVQDTISDRFVFNTDADDIVRNDYKNHPVTDADKQKLATIDLGADKLTDLIIKLDDQIVQSRRDNDCTTATISDGKWICLRGPGSTTKICEHKDKIADYGGKAYDVTNGDC